MSMNYNAKRVENIVNNRPKVLFVGNGVLREVNGISWDKLLEDISYVEDKLKDISYIKDKKSFLKKLRDNKEIPYSIKSQVMMQTEDEKRRNRYSDYLQKDYLKYYQKENPYIEKLLNIKCDTILTTNYTYEIENALCPGFYSFSNDRKCKYLNTTNKKPEKKADKKEDSRKIPKNMSEYYHFKHSSGDDKYIWHIHGEARKKSSLVLTTDEYGRLVRDILNVNNANKNKYASFPENIRINTWIDYFMIADIYVLGFGLNFSEIDIWWLLNRRIREKSGHGKVYFFEPEHEGDNSLYKFIYNEFDIKQETLGYKMPNVNYEKFYDEAIEKIELMIKGDFT